VTKQGGNKLACDFFAVPDHALCWLVDCPIAVFCTRPSPKCCANRFTRSATVLKKVGGLLLPPSTRSILKSPPRWLVAADAFKLAKSETVAAIYAVMSDPEAKQRINQLLGEPEEVQLAAALAPDGLGELHSWVEVFRVTQAR